MLRRTFGLSLKLVSDFVEELFTFAFGSIDSSLFLKKGIFGFLNHEDIAVEQSTV
jgi:hypothetical protein